MQTRESIQPMEARTSTGGALPTIQQPGQLRPAQSTTPAELLQIAVQQGADLDRLERLMALQERWEANEARKAFTTAMAAFKAEPLEIFKRKHVSFTTRDGDTTSYNHAELSDVTAVVCPALSRHGLSHRWDVQQTGSTITVECIVRHAQGHAETCSLSAPPDTSGKKNSIQQVASTVTYLQRYTLLSIVGAATKGMDDDGRAGGASNDEAPSATGEASPEEVLRSEGFLAAESGMDVLTTWWGQLNPKQRSLMNKHFGTMRKAARSIEGTAA